MAQSKKRKQQKVRQLKFKTGQVLVGSCLERLRDLPDGSVHSIVTDPPYELSFMGKAWDGTGVAYQVELWAECLRVLKPGGHLLAFGGTRTYHRMAVAIEDAGFEIRDSIHWIYGSGFPKSLDVSKAIDKAAGAKTWQGWGTALKPAHEPIVVARKPLDGTVAANVLAHGTGALNIDGCRVAHAVGRWPANVIFDEAAGAELDAQSGIEASRFFYCPKAGKKERNAGLTKLAEVRQSDRVADDRPGGDNPRNRSNAAKQNFHPTVKPVALMRYLVRLVTPPGGTVLDPFLGSGTTAVAAILEGFTWVGCEMTADYLPIIRGRVQWAQKKSREHA